MNEHKQILSMHKQNKLCKIMSILRMKLQALRIKIHKFI